MGSSGSSVAFRATSCIRPSENIVHDFHDKYVLGPKLGRGAFAEVYLTKKISDGTAQASTQTAVKVSSRGTTQRQNKSLLVEEELWSAVSHHNNCVRLYEVFHGESLSYMVMERCKCSLYQHIKAIPDLTERTLGPILRQMLQSLYQVHSAHVVHRDIKPDNFLIGGADGQTVKLCDFGLSAGLGSKQLFHIVGTPPFMCPEMLLGEGCDFKADLWSLGVIAYTFLFGIFPYMPKYRSSSRMKKAIAEGVPPTFVPVRRYTTNTSKFRSSSTMDFVRSLLNRQPEQRPSAIEALNMEYITSIANDCHALSIDLPSLEPMISAAQEVGFFELQDVDKHREVDLLLSDLQMERHQIPLFKRRSPKASSTKVITALGDTPSDTLSMPSTECPSEVESRHQTEMESPASTPKLPPKSGPSWGLRTRSKTESESRIVSKILVESRIASKTLVESRLRSISSAETSFTPKTLDKSSNLGLVCHSGRDLCAKSVKTEA